MKQVSIVLLIVMVSMASCVINQEKEIAEESKPSSFQPEPRDDSKQKWSAHRVSGAFPPLHRTPFVAIIICVGGNQISYQLSNVLNNKTCPKRRNAS